MNQAELLGIAEAIRDQSVAAVQALDPHISAEAKQRWSNPQTPATIAVAVAGLDEESQAVLWAQARANTFLAAAVASALGGAEWSPPE